MHWLLPIFVFFFFADFLRDFLREARIARPTAPSRNTFLLVAGFSIVRRVEAILFFLCKGKYFMSLGGDERRHAHRDDFGILVASHALTSRFLTPAAKPDAEVVIFLDFRPHWLRRQRRVYEALATQTCSICMYDHFAERIAKQHNPNHPAVCTGCLTRLVLCPFCRAWLPQLRQQPIGAVNNTINTINSIPRLVYHYAAGGTRRIL